MIYGEAIPGKWEREGRKLSKDSGKVTSRVILTEFPGGALATARTQPREKWWLRVIRHMGSSGLRPAAHNEA